MGGDRMEAMWLSLPSMNVMLDMVIICSGKQIVLYAKIKATLPFIMWEQFESQATWSQFRYRLRVGMTFPWTDNLYDIWIQT